MTTVILRICDVCGREHRDHRFPADWCELHFSGGKLDGEAPLLCRECMQVAYGCPVILVLLERHQAERERECRISKSDPRNSSKS
jgi:hypothetical protein